MRWRMSVHDMNRVKLCELYDSELKPEGQLSGADRARRQIGLVSIERAQTQP